MIDIHCHLLPGIDDGPPTLEAAMALAKALADDGVETVVCTPHVFPGRFENRRSSIADEFENFSTVMAQSGIALKLMWAGEVRLTPEVLDLLARDEVPFLGRMWGRRTLLLEMPDGQIPIGADRFVSHLMTLGIRPVLVHPERNRAVMDKPERLRPLMERGCFTQVTAASVTGHFGERAQLAVEYLLANGWVHAVASDAHNLDGRRPRMSEAARWLGKRHGERVARELTVLGPAALCGDNAAVNQPDSARSRQFGRRHVP